MATLNADLDKQMARRKFLLLQQERADKGSFDRIDTMLGGRPKPKLGVDGGGGGGGGAIKELADGYEALMQKLRTKIDLDQQEIALGRQLSDSEKLQIDVYNEVEKNFQKLSIAKMLSIDETLQMALALGKERRAQEENLKWMKELDLQQHVGLQETFLRVRATQDELKLMQEQVQQYGLTAEELNAVTSARMRDAAAQLDWKAQFNGSTEFLEAQAQLYRDQAEAMRGMADARDLLSAKEAKDRNDPLSGAQRAVKDYMADVKRAGDATYGAVANSVKGLEDLTVTALMGGDAKAAARAWVNGILSEMYRMGVVKPFFAALFGKDALGGGGGLGGLTDLIGGLFKGSGGGGFGGAGSGGDGFAGFAKGDVFDRATPFRFASGGAFKRGIMGEAGPEAVMPLTRGADGKLGVAAQGGGGSRQVMVNVINNGAPVQAKSTQRETSEGTVIELVLDAVAADVAGGGRVHDSVQRRFGLNPGGSTPRY